jgi:hypothetical protein
MAKEYIDKEAFIAFIYRGHLRAPWEPCFTENDVVEMVKAFPAADVRENVRAHWYDVGSLSCRCSVCGCKSNRETAFCPNCGARMGGAEDA